MRLSNLLFHHATDKPQRQFVLPQRQQLALTATIFRPLGVQRRHPPGHRVQVPDFVISCRGGQHNFSAIAFPQVLQRSRYRPPVFVDEASGLLCRDPLQTDEKEDVAIKKVRCVCRLGLGGGDGRRRVCRRVAASMSASTIARCLIVCFYMSASTIARCLMCFYRLTRLRSRLNVGVVVLFMITFAFTLPPPLVGGPWASGNRLNATGCAGLIGIRLRVGIRRGSRGGTNA